MYTNIFFSVVFVLMCLGVSALPVLADKEEEARIKAVNTILPDKNTLGHHAGSLPDGDVSTYFIPWFIDIMMKISYTVAVVVIIYAGVLYVIAQGDDGMISEAKNIFIFGAVGFLVMTVAYAMVYGILNFDFF